MPLDEDARTLTDSQFEISLGKVGPGTVVFGRYKLQKELGRGGMGVVWLALDTRVDVTVALKFLPDVVARDAECVEELKRELRRGLNLTHPSIVRVYSFEQDETGAAIAMEYVDGPTLSSLKLKRAGSCFDCDELLPYVEQLCAALDYAHHEARIVHRDLKPRNLMLNTKGRLKIADFGVATSIAETLSRSAVRNDGSGTPPYMSPQQAFGENPSPSDDIYSLGATLYELLTGRPPFYQGNILAQVQQRIPPPMNDRREVLKITRHDPIPEHWEKTVAACLAKHASDRPQRAAEVFEYLSGKRPPPAVEQTQEAPIVPVVSRNTSPPPPEMPAVRRGGRTKPVREHDETVAAPRRRSVPPPPPPPTEFVPPSGRTRSAAWLVLLVVIGAAIGLWKWQQERDDQEAGSPSHQQNADATEMPVATPVPTQTLKEAEMEKEKELDKEREKTMAAENEAKAKQEEAAAREALKRDFERIVKGELPRRDAPWENSRRMRFVPVPGLPGLVGVHETRFDDYRAFSVETKRPWIPTEFSQGDDHPAVNVSWDDAHAFCAWLTESERKSGHLGSQQRYRLPTDLEWSAAAGMIAEEGETPGERNGKATGSYGWPTPEMPVERAGNFAGEGETTKPETEIVGYHDGYTHTAPVGKFIPNAFGLHDVAGNVAEWVEDWFDQTKTERTVRGSAWLRIAEHDLLSSFRWKLKPGEFEDYVGFRVVLDCGQMPEHLPPLPAPAAAEAPQPHGALQQLPAAPESVPIAPPVVPSPNKTR
jgi:serine/threonine protein kinase/formylglycine-generating enzyme required for sulfatase activity